MTHEERALELFMLGHFPADKEATDALVQAFREVERSASASERERCAEVCGAVADKYETRGFQGRMDAANECAEQIRALPDDPNPAETT